MEKNITNGKKFICFVWFACYNGRKMKEGCTMELYERIRERCKKFKISYRELAKRTGIPQSSIQRYLSGTKPIPLDRLEIIARNLHTSSPVLMGYLPDNVPVQTRNLGRKNKEKTRENACISANSRVLYVVEHRGFEPIYGALSNCPENGCFPTYVHGFRRF